MPLNICLYEENPASNEIPLLLTFTENHRLSLFIDQYFHQVSFLKSQLTPYVFRNTHSTYIVDSSDNQGFFGSDILSLHNSVLSWLCHRAQPMPSPMVSSLLGYFLIVLYSRLYVLPVTIR